ncbi:unnamed protein product, partial [Meganyctiphanes norvegica]
AVLEGVCRAESPDPQASCPTLSRQSSEDSGLWTSSSSTGGGDHQGSSSPEPPPSSPVPPSGDLSGQLTSEKLRQLDLINRNILADFARKLQDSDEEEQEAPGAFVRGRSHRKSGGKKGRKGAQTSRSSSRPGSGEHTPLSGSLSRAVGNATRDAWRELAGVTPSRRLLQLMRRLQDKFGDSEPSALDHVTYGRSPGVSAGTRAPLKGVFSGGLGAPPRPGRKAAPQLAVASNSEALVCSGGQTRILFNTANLQGLKADLLNNNGLSPDPLVCLGHSGVPSDQWTQLTLDDMTHQKNHPGVPTPVRPHRSKSRKRQNSPRGERVPLRPLDLPGKQTRDNSRTRELDNQFKRGGWERNSCGRTPNRQRDASLHGPVRDASRSRDMSKGNKEHKRDSSPSKVSPSGLPIPRGRDRTSRSQTNKGELPPPGKVSSLGPRGLSQPPPLKDTSSHSKTEMHRPSSHNPRARDKGLPNNKEINSSVSRFKNDVLAALSVKLLPNNNHLRTPPPVRKNQPFSTAGKVSKGKLLPKDGIDHSRKSKSVTRENGIYHESKGYNSGLESEPDICKLSDDLRKMSTDSSSSGVSGSSYEGPLSLDEEDILEVIDNKIILDSRDSELNLNQRNLNRTTVNGSNSNYNINSDLINGYNSYDNQLYNSECKNQPMSKNIKKTNPRNKTNNTTNNVGSGGYSPHAHLHTQNNPNTYSPKPRPRTTKPTSQGPKIATHRSGPGRGVDRDSSTCEESDFEKKDSPKRGRVKSIKCSKKKGTVAVLINRYDNPDTQVLTKQIKKLTSSRMSILRPNKNKRPECPVAQAPVFKVPQPPSATVIIGRGNGGQSSGSNKENKKHRSRVHLGTSEASPSVNQRGARKPLKEEVPSVKATTISIPMGPMHQASPSPKKKLLKDNITPGSKAAKAPKSIPHKPVTSKGLNSPRPRSGSRLIRKETFRITRGSTGSGELSGTQIKPSLRLRYLMQRAQSTSNSDDSAEHSAGEEKIL